jgi:hypothetical protein
MLDFLSVKASARWSKIPDNSHSWVDRIENRADFLGALVLDLWANNCDRRQSVFFTDDRDRLHARFIDSDSMFGGKFGNDTTCPRRAMVYD